MHGANTEGIRMKSHEHEHEYARGVNRGILRFKPKPALRRLILLCVTAGLGMVSGITSAVTFTPSTTATNVGTDPIYETTAGGTFNVKSRSVYDGWCGPKAKVSWVSGSCTNVNVTDDSGGWCWGSAEVNPAITMNAVPTDRCVIKAEAWGVAESHHEKIYTIGLKQTITVDTAAPAGPQTYNTSFNVAAHSNAGASCPVTVSTGGGCSGGGNTTGAGSPVAITMTSGTTACTVTYTRGVCGAYNAATNVSSNTTAQKASQAIMVTIPAPAGAEMGETFNVDATATVMPVTVTTSGGCSGTGAAPRTITITSGVTPCTLTYSQSGNANYSAAPNVVSVTTTNKANQYINVTQEAPLVAYVGNVFTVIAESRSSRFGTLTGMGVSITTAGSCSGSGTNSAIITMTSDSGVCTITYAQAGDASWNAADPVINYVEALTMMCSGLRLDDSGGYMGWACNGSSISCWPPMHWPWPWHSGGWSIQPGIGFKGHVLQTARNPGKIFKIQKAPGAGSYYNVINMTDNTCWAVGNAIYECSGTRKGSNCNAGYLTAIQDSATLPGAPCDYNADHVKWELVPSGGGFKLKTNGGVWGYGGHCIGTATGLDRLLIHAGHGNYGNWGDVWVRNAAPSCADSGTQLTCDLVAPLPPDHVRFEFDPSAATNFPQPIKVSICTNPRTAIGSAGTCDVWMGGAKIQPVVTEGTANGTAAWAKLTHSPKTAVTPSGGNIEIRDTEEEVLSFSYINPSVALADAVLECYDTMNDVAIPCTMGAGGGMVVGLGSFDTFEHALEATDPGLTDTSLYTKLAGVQFPVKQPVASPPDNDAFVLRAVRTYGGVKSTLLSYNGTPTSIELVDATTGDGCSTATPLANPAVASFAPTVPAQFSSGRLTIAPTVALPYAKLRVRIRDTNVTNGYHCSTDSFSVRPTELQVTLTNSADPLVAGKNTNDPDATYFTLKATARSGWVAGASTADVASGYNGSPSVKIDNVLDWNNVAIEAAALTTDGVNGAAPTFTAANGVFASNKFYYDDFGPVTFSQTHIVEDQSWTESASSDKTAGDCVADGTVASYANVENASRMYGCYVGSTASSPATSNRFRPFKYKLSTNLTSAGACGFTYVGQNFGGGGYTLQALSAAGTVLKRLGAGAPDAPTFEFKAYNGTTLVTDALPSPALPALVWTTGQYQIADFSTYKVQKGNPIGNYENFLFGAVVTNPAADTVPFGAADCTDGAGHTAAPAVAGQVSTCIPPATTYNGDGSVNTAGSSTRLRYGIVKMENAYGSELLPLDVAVTALYRRPNNSWMPNTLDSCTTLAANGAAVAYGNFKGGLTSTNVTRPTVTTFSGGRALMRFAAPAATGSFDVALNLGAAAAIGSGACLWTLPTTPGVNSVAGAGLDHLKGSWCGGASNYTRDPAAHITFGAAKSPYLYRRERY